MRTHTSRRLLLGLVAVLGIGFLALLPRLMGAADESVASGPTRPEPSSPERRSPALAQPAQPAQPEPPGSLSPAPRSEVQIGRSRLLVLRRTDRTPLAGISLFAGDVLLGGPSDVQGLIEFVRPASQPLVVWGPGWLPAFLPGYVEVPETVLLEEAAARLEVRLIGMDPEDAVVRSLLQPHLFQVAGDSPWNPALRSTARDRLAGERLPAGDYDVYVWVARGRQPARCLESAGVRVAGGAPVVLELDAAAPVVPEPDR